MGYVDENLMKDEKIVATAKIHWMDLATGLFWWFLLFIPPILAAIRMWTTELAVTSHRVIGKQGLVGRHTTDVMLDKVQNVTVHQGISGRMWNYGSCTITTAGESTTFAGIAKPQDFKKAVINQVEICGQAKMQQQAEAIAKAMKQNQ